jgi:hypothetical protein
MMFSQDGGCQCGALRYRITRAPSAIYTCHCSDCQRLTGSAFGMSFIVAAEAFRLKGTDPRSFQRTADSGRIYARWVCPACGCWICSGGKPGSEQPGELRNVRAGTLDDTSWLRPTVHLWTRSAQPWVVLPEGSRSFATQPADYLTALLPIGPEASVRF